MLKNWVIWAVASITARVLIAAGVPDKYVLVAGILVAIFLVIRWLRNTFPRTPKHKSGESTHVGDTNGIV